MSDSDGEKPTLVKEVKPQKEKKPQSEAQKERTRKMLAALKAKRDAAKADLEKDMEALDEVKREEAATKAYEDAKKRKLKKLPPVPNYVTSTQLQLMEKRLTETLLNSFTEIVKPVKAPEPVKPIVKEDLPVIPTKPIIVKEPPKIISGNALLDSIFFK
jgi:septal ring factor EnvC (AmiA/AmiB activator)